MAVASTAALVLGVVNVIGAANTLQMANQAGHNGGSSSSPDTKEAAKVGSSLYDISRAAGATDRGGLTKAGRALEKHGSRPGSAFPPATGSVANKNALGQNVVDDILTSPGATTTTRHHARFGDVTEITATDGRGVRLDSNGNFIGFLEP